MTTTVNGLIAPSPEDPLFSVADTVTQLRDQLANTKLADTGWKRLDTAQFGAGWSAYTEGGWAPGVMIRKMFGIVFVNGAIRKSTAVVGGETALTLPVGYRPSYSVNGYASGFGMTAQTSGAVTMSTPFPTAGIPFGFFLIFPTGGV